MCTYAPSKTTYRICFWHQQKRKVIFKFLNYSPFGIIEAKGTKKKRRKESKKNKSDADRIKFVYRPLVLNKLALCVRWNILYPTKIQLRFALEIFIKFYLYNFVEKGVEKLFYIILNFFSLRF